MDSSLDGVDALVSYYWKGISDGSWSVVSESHLVDKVLAVARVLGCHALYLRVGFSMSSNYCAEYDDLHSVSFYRQGTSHPSRMLHSFL